MTTARKLKQLLWAIVVACIIGIVALVAAGGSLLILGFSGRRAERRRRFLLPGPNSAYGGGNVNLGVR